MARAAFSLSLPRVNLRSALTRNVPLKLGALGIALLMFIVQSLVPQEAEQATTTFAGIPVSRVNLPEGFVLRGSLGSVEVSVRGPVGELRTLAVSSFQAEADLSQYDLRRAGELQELPVQVRAARSSVRVIEIGPSVIAAKLVAVESKSLTVQVRPDNQPPSGSEAEPAKVTPTEVRVRGPADALREVVSVFVHVRFPGDPIDLSISPPALAVDAAGHEVADVEVAPQNVAVSIRVRPANPTRTVGVIPSVKGQPAAGHWVASAIAEPAVVTLRGDPSVLKAVDKVETVAIDVGGASADKVVRAFLLVPFGTSLTGSDFVQVTVTVRPAGGTRLFPLVGVQPTGLRADLRADLDPASIEVLLSGTVSVLQAVLPDQVTASIDLSGKAPGRYEIEPVVRVPTGTTAGPLNVTKIIAIVRLR